MDITAHAKSTTERGFVGAHLVGALGHPLVAALGRFRPLVETGTTRVSYKIAALGQLRRTISFSTPVGKSLVTAQHSHAGATPLQTTVSLLSRNVSNPSHLCLTGVSESSRGPAGTSYGMRRYETK